MHPSAFEFVKQHATTESVAVIEIGSRDINGSVRPHFPNAKWIGLDLISGPGVDVVCDALDYTPCEPVDVVICCEVFEHCPYWPDIINRVFYWLKPGGKLIITCAGPGRDPHSAIDGGELHPDENYANVTQEELQANLIDAGFSLVETSGNEHWKDTYAVAMKA